MNKRIRVNGVLYEQVSRNRAKTRRLIESKTDDFDYILKIVKKLSESEKIDLWNDILSEDSEDYSLVILYMRDFDENEFTVDEEDLDRFIKRGNFNPRDKYYWFDDGAYYSFDRIPVTDKEIAQAVIDNEVDIDKAVKRL